MMSVGARSGAGCAKMSTRAKVSTANVSPTPERPPETLLCPLDSRPTSIAPPAGLADDNPLDLEDGPLQRVHLGGQPSRGRLVGWRS